VNGGEAKLPSGEQAGAGEVLFLELDGDLVDALFRGLSGAAEPDGRAGERLKLERHMFKDVRLVRPSSEPFEEPAAFTNATAVLDHRRKPRHQSFVEPGQLVRRRILQGAEIDPRLEDREVGPVVRAAQRQNLPELHADSSPKTAARHPPRGFAVGRGRAARSS